MYLLKTSLKYILTLVPSTFKSQVEQHLIKGFGCWVVSGDWRCSERYLQNKYKKPLLEEALKTRGLGMYIYMSQCQFLRSQSYYTVLKRVGSDSGGENVASIFLSKTDGVSVLIRKRRNTISIYIPVTSSFSQSDAIFETKFLTGSHPLRPCSFLNFRPCRVWNWAGIFHLSRHLFPWYERDRISGWLSGCRSSSPPKIISANKNKWRTQAPNSRLHSTDGFVCIIQSCPSLPPSTSPGLKHAIYVVKRTRYTTPFWQAGIY